MAWLALGGLVLLLTLVGLRAFAGASVAQVKTAVIWAGGGLGAVLLVALLLSGRASQAIWTIVLLGPLFWRAWQSWRAARAFSRGGQASPGGETTVETRTLELTLHHDSGRMTGRVRRGAFAGADLADLALPELLSLLADCQVEDPESAPLLEAWLDRAHPGWRETPPPRSPAASGRMTRAEALAVLGLSEGATEEEIRAAHRRLMQAAHPDRGGSDWIAARLNEARDTLL